MTRRNKILQTVNMIFCAFLFGMTLTINHSILIIALMCVITVLIFFTYKIQTKFKIAILIIENLILASIPALLFLFFGTVTTSGYFHYRYSFRELRISHSNTNYLTKQSFSPIKPTNNVMQRVSEKFTLPPSILCPEDIETQYHNYIDLDGYEFTYIPWIGKKIYCSYNWIDMTYARTSKKCTVYNDAIVFDSVLIENGKYICIKISKNFDSAFAYE